MYMYTDNLIQSRLSNDERGWKQLCKRVLNSNKIDEQEDLNFNLEFKKFNLQIDRSSLLEKAINDQSKEENDERLRMRDECNKVIEDNKRLKDELAMAQLERERKLEYNSLAMEIFKYPSKSDSLKAIEALENSIKQLNDTKNLQRLTFSQRATTFAEILSACEKLQNDVGEEAEEGRRRALLEVELENDDDNNNNNSSNSNNNDEGNGNNDNDKNINNENNNDGDDGEPSTKRIKLDPNAPSFEPSNKRELEEGEEVESQHDNQHQQSQ